MGHIEIRHWRNRKPPWFIPLSGQTPEQWRAECQRQDKERSRQQQKKAAAANVRICQGKGCSNVLTRRKKKYCCNACFRSPEGLAMEDRNCQHCGKVFPVPPSRAKRCCSVKCARRLYESKKKQERNRNNG